MKQSVFKKLYRFTGQVLIVGLLSLLLFELCFRIYVIDFYADTFDSLNNQMESRMDKPTLLIVGDSFSAFKGGYPQTLHDTLPHYRVRNISVPGTSIIEQFLFGRYHIKREQPDVIVFQFYVGNDFLGWRHQLNWEELSAARNVYWKLSEHIWSLGYLNHQLSTFGATIKRDSTVKYAESPFNPDQYSMRDKYYFKSEPGLVENTAYLKGGRENDLRPYLDRIQKLFDYATDDTQIFLLMIPHCSQVNKRYYNRTKQLGALFSNDFESGSTSYPLCDRFIKHFKNDQRVTVLNPISFLQEMESQVGNLYFHNDSHLNPVGQEAIGQYLLRNLKLDKADVD
ncbi:SGNH/GDSL hydrolase family protein [Roseivirga sp. E12]|uniref:SGNH/GDSL hydrolase family protein n=1 Tax=Roseivirga sp. E12 TaxID=2819237 RepID=UPI001ABCFD41|nr:SGNH/GDSL hydrolase family protein [Roseivirga sp. E12]MBO3699331.1 SGNH/GDSL hydrolase family protein [Roseivirga sp. E12]